MFIEVRFIVPANINTYGYSGVNFNTLVLPSTWSLKDCSGEEAISVDICSQAKFIGDLCDKDNAILSITKFFTQLYTNGEITTFILN